MRRLLFVVLAGACTGSRQPPPPTFEAGDPAITIINTTDLRAHTVIDAIAIRVPDIRMEKHTGECPYITIRTTRSLPTTGRVAIYVDGSLARDSCVLSGFSPGAVERIEVYPGGVATRPGYPRNEHGMILIFRRKY